MSVPETDAQRRRFMGQRHALGRAQSLETAIRLICQTINSAVTDAHNAADFRDQEPNFEQNVDFEDESDMETAAYALPDLLIMFRRELKDAKRPAGGSR